MSSPPSLIGDIEGWNGKSAAAITAVYQSQIQGRTREAELIDMVGEANLQRGASWLLKHHLEHGHVLKPALAVRFYSHVLTLNHWETQLHVLQCLPYVPVPDEQKQRVQTFLNGCLASKRTLVRAWGYAGVAELAAQYDDDRSSAVSLLQNAAEHESAASVRVRIRKALTRLGESS